MATASDSRTDHARLHENVPTLAEIIAARDTVARVADPTPMESSRYLGEVLGAPVHLKCENLQRTGSYKIRGAYNLLSKLTAAERERGVVAASAGNHAQGVAFAARELDIRATIFMPNGVALPKLQATRNYGADVVLGGDTVTEPLERAEKFARETGAIIVPPFDHRDIVIGQGTLGLDILDQNPETETVLVPIGGGGLISGVASAVKRVAERDGRHIRVVGVQAENAAAYPPSIAAGAPRSVTIRPTIADGIAVGRPGDLPFSIIRDLVDDVITVTDDEIALGMLALLERAKLVVEPAGAVGVAAIMAGKVEPLGPTVSILSGGNIDPLLMQRIVSHGLETTNRYLKLKVMLPDRPGQLARTAELVASADANVVEVQHTRHGGGLQLGDVELELHIETRGNHHRDQVIAVLQDAGYQISVIND